MDTLRFFSDTAGTDAQWHDDPLDLTGFEQFAEEDACTAPPPAIGQDERRMQVRAYNFWAGLLGDADFPEIARLDPGGHPDFGPHSVLLDLSEGLDDPRIVHLGDLLSKACGSTLSAGPVPLSQLSGNCLLSRITDHYCELIANRAPIGFEAEFASGPGRLSIYRGILLPFSSNGQTIDHVYGVLNWKELVDEETAQQLARDMEQAEHANDGDDTTPWGGKISEPTATRMRAMSPVGFDDLDEDGPEFTLLMARRLSSGNVVLLGEVPPDNALVERLARRMKLPQID